MIDLGKCAISIGGHILEGWADLPDASDETPDPAQKGNSAMTEPTVTDREFDGMTLRKRLYAGVYPYIPQGSRVYHAATGTMGVFLCAVSGLEEFTGVVRLDDGFNPSEWPNKHGLTDVPVGGPRDVKIDMSELEEIVE